MPPVHELPAGAEIDLQVAHLVMGFAGERPPDRPLISEGWVWVKCAKAYRRDFCASCTYDGLGETWAPSTNIAHAWEVVEKLRERHAVRVDAYRHDRYYCLLGNKEFGDIAQVSAETAPLAICRAALKAVA